MPFYIEKSLEIKTNDPALYITERVKNCSKQKLDYQWGHHPNFGVPFLDENCRIEMIGGNVKVNQASGNSRLIPGMEGEWPFIKDIDGKYVDLRCVKPQDSGFYEVIEINDLKQGQMSLANQKTGLGIVLEWDKEMFKHNTIWHVTNGDPGYPRYQDTYVLGFVIEMTRSGLLRNQVRLEQDPLSLNPQLKQALPKQTWETEV